MFSDNLSVMLYGAVLTAEVMWHQIRYVRKIVNDELVCGRKCS